MIDYGTTSIDDDSFGIALDGTAEKIVKAGVWHLAFCFWQLDVAGVDVAEDVRGAIGYSHSRLIS